MADLFRVLLRMPGVGARRYAQVEVHDRFAIAQGGRLSDRFREDPSFDRRRPDRKTVL